MLDRAKAVAFGCEVLEVSNCLVEQLVERLRERRMGRVPVVVAADDVHVPLLDLQELVLMYELRVWAWPGLHNVPIATKSSSRPVKQ